MSISRVLLNLSKQYPSFTLFESGLAVKNVANNVNFVGSAKLSSTNFISIPCRYSHSFFSRITAEHLWKGVTSVSNAGRKKGRGKGSNRRLSKDLNRGQVIGFGKKNMLWPGLNAPVIQGKEVLRQQELPPDEEREKRILEIRSRVGSGKRLKIHPLERGWSGTKLPGRSLGPPDPIGEETFEGFDSRVLEFKPVLHMTKNGRVRSLSALVVVGNKNGLAGFALAKSVNGTTAANGAKNKAAKLLRYIERDNTTVLHDFYCEYGPSRIFVEKRPEGYGLVCHRLIKAICEMLGIKDLYAKVDGSTNNYNCLTKAFFIGLMKQKSLQKIANEKGLHIVELRPECDNFPTVIASPDKCRTEEEIEPTEMLDYTLHLHNGKVEQERKKYQPFYINFPSFIKEMKDREKLRNHHSVKLHHLAKYGALKGFIQIREEEKAKQQLKDTVEKS